MSVEQKTTGDPAHDLALRTVQTLAADLIGMGRDSGAPLDFLAYMMTGLTSVVVFELGDRCTVAVLQRCAEALEHHASTLPATRLN